MVFAFRKLKSRLAGPLRKIGRAARWVHGWFPVTRLGLATLAVGLAAVWFEGVLRLDLVLLIAGLAAIAAVILMTAITVIATFLTKRNLRKAGADQTIELEIGTSLPTGFQIPYPRWLPFVHLRWNWQKPASVMAGSVKAMGKLWEQAAAGRRAYLDSVERRIRVGDIFGLTEMSWRYVDPVPVRILPPAHAVDRLPELLGLAQGEDLADPFGATQGDRVEMRQYAHGDSPRMILWKLYARTGKLMVRVPERAITQRKRGALYLVSAQTDQSAAALARGLIESDLLGDEWCFSASGESEPAYKDRRRALDVLARSGNLTESSPNDLQNFINRIGEQGYDFCIVLLPSRPKEAAHALDHLSTSGHLRLFGCVGIEKLQVDPPREWPKWKKILFRPPTHALPSVDQMRNNGVPGAARFDALMLYVRGSSDIRMM